MLEGSEVWLTAKPAWPSRLEASAIVLPTTSGTGRWAGPLDTKIVTSEPRGASSLGPGSWSTTSPTGAASSTTGSSFTVNPSAGEPLARLRDLGPDDVGHGDGLRAGADLQLHRGALVDPLAELRVLVEHVARRLVLVGLLGDLHVEPLVAEDVLGLVHRPADHVRHLDLPGGGVLAGELLGQQVEHPGQQDQEHDQPDEEPPRRPLRLGLVLVVVGRLAVGGRDGGGGRHHAGGARVDQRDHHGLGQDPAALAEAPQVGPEVLGRGVAVHRVLGQALEDDRLDGRRGAPG